MNNCHIINTTVSIPFDSSYQSLRHDLSHDRFTNVSNSVFTLNNHSIITRQSMYEPHADRFKLMYVKYPFVSRNEVK